MFSKYRYDIYDFFSLFFTSLSSISILNVSSAQKKTSDFTILQVIFGKFNYLVILRAHRVLTDILRDNPRVERYTRLRCFGYRAPFAEEALAPYRKYYGLEILPPVTVNLETTGP